MLVPNSRDQPGKPWLPKKQKMVRNQYSLQIATSHKSLYAKLLAP